MADSHEYSVDLNWQQDRKGTMSSAVLNTTIEVATPPEFPKGMPGIWSPEHLFVASVCSCLMTTFLAVAENSKLEFSNFECHAKGVLAKKDNKFQITEVHLFPSVTIPSTEKKERAERILEKSEQHCLISNSILSKISMQTTVKVAG
ncbi:OsmC family protein [uncultured Planktosalinus sp.]|uniref:OsmC family protein n=1 Tax=uncultured Planktosalinus sp. TaxID=1810935 RepID=UPI0030DA077A|tara:strand:+ start:372 stop:812 length:441 start_codon:yes stop_codon:yes gene_type:complete